MRDTCTCTPVRAFRFYYQSTYTYMSASVFCGPFARPGGVLARGRLPPAAGRPRARRIRLSYRLVKSQWFIGYVCMLTCAHINIVWMKRYDRQKRNTAFEHYYSVTPLPPSKYLCDSFFLRNFKAVYIFLRPKHCLEFKNSLSVMAVACWHHRTRHRVAQPQGPRQSGWTSARARALHQRRTGELPAWRHVRGRPIRQEDRCVSVPAQWP